MTIVGNKAAIEFKQARPDFYFGVNTDGQGIRGPNTEFGGLAALAGNTSLGYPGSGAGVEVAEGQLFRVGPHCLQVAAASALTGYDWTTGAGGALKLRALRGADNLVSAEALGCEIVSTYGAAASAADATSRIQKALDRGYDVFVPGWARIDGRLSASSRRVIGAGRGQSGLYPSSAGAGVTLLGTDARIEDISIIGNYTATHLLRIGEGVQGDTLRAVFRNIYLGGAKTRCLLVRENANFAGQNSIIKQAGARNAGGVVDADAVAAEVRCIGWLVDCEISTSTYAALLVTGHADWEEVRLTIMGCRLMTGYEHIAKVVSYSHRMVAHLNVIGGYIENPGLAENGGYSNPAAGPAFVAQGRGALLTLDNVAKATARRASEVAVALDDARVMINDMGPVKYQRLGLGQVGQLVRAQAVTAVAFASGLSVRDPGLVVTNGGVEYTPHPGAIPFVTTSTFDAAQWVEVKYGAETAFASGLVIDSPEKIVNNGGVQYQPRKAALPFTTTGTFDASQWTQRKRRPGRIFMDRWPQCRGTDNIENGDFTLYDWSALASIVPRVGGYGLNITGARLYKTLADGISLPSGISYSSCAGSNDTTAGTYLSAGSSIKLTGSAGTGAANVKFPFTVTEEMVGQFFMLRAPFRLGQVGSDFGGSLTYMLADIGIEDGTGKHFPASASRSGQVRVDAPGASAKSEWYFAEHVFWPRYAGTLTFVLRWDVTSGVARDDVCWLDKLELWSIPSVDFGTIS